MPAKILLALALLLSVAQARIGETREQITKRFGLGKEVGDQTLHTYGPYSVTVYFDQQGRVTMEVYAKPLTNELERPDLTASEQSQLLSEHAEGFRWEGFRSSRGTPMWRRSDGRVLAEFKAGQKVLVFVGAEPGH